MNLFVAVVNKTKKSLKRTSRFLDTAIKATTPSYQKYNYTISRWNDDQTIAASISLHESHVAIKKYASSNDYNFLTFNGIPIFDKASSTVPWADSLLNQYRERKLQVNQLGGYYNLLIADHNGLIAYNSITRTEPLYWIENETCAVVGNRASLVYAMAYQTLDFQYNLDALITMCTIGWPAHDLVPFQGVNLLDCGSCIKIDKHGRVSIEEYKPYEYEEGINESKIDEVYDDLCHEFITSVKVFKQFSDNITIGLTGGKDSRLAAALCKEAGVNFSCVTSGTELDRDVIVAKEIAEILQVDHRFTKPKKKTTIPEVNIFDYLERQIIQGEGLSNIYDPCYPVREVPTIQFAGHGGACFKGGYDNIKGGRREKVTDQSIALKFVNNLNCHNSGRVLHKEVNEKLSTINQSIVNKFFASTFPPENFYDYMYTVYREGRGTSMSRQASAYGSFQNSPFLNDNAIRLALKIPLEQRVNHKLYYHILNRINPELAHHRFADSRWKFEEDGPEEGTSFDDWKKREPLPPSPKGHQAKNWRMGYDTYLKPIIKDYLFSNEKSEVFNIIDEKKLQTLLNQEGPTSMSVVRTVYGILGTAYFVNNDWVKYPPKKNLFERIFKF